MVALVIVAVVCHSLLRPWRANSVPSASWDMCRLVEDWPIMLHVESFEATMLEAQRMMPGKDIEAMIANNPSIVFSFQRGSALIPYDPPDNSDG